MDGWLIELYFSGGVETTDQLSAGKLMASQRLTIFHVGEHGE